MMDGIQASESVTVTAVTDATASSSNFVSSGRIKIKSEPDSSDLKNTKTELFNKLISSQSQQLSVARPTSSGNEAKNLHSSSSSSPSNEDARKHNSSNCDQVEQEHQKSTSNCTSNKQQKDTDNTTTGNNSNSSSSSVNNNSNRQSISLPDDFKQEPVVFSRSRSRWYTNDEVASLLTNFSSHPEWQTNELQVRPQSGAVLLYSREKVRYRQDGYCWKKRKNGRTTREDHMKLKVQGIECIYGCYVHSAILPTFHRRCYWLLQNPDIVLVHYLNQPPDDQNKMVLTFNSNLLEADTRRSWTNEEIIEEIGSVFGGISQIHHTLNINFPSSSAVMSNQQNMQLQQANDFDKLVESSPHSGQLNSEVINELVDMAVVDQPQSRSQLKPKQTNRATESLTYQEQSDIDNKGRDDDEMMTTISQDSNIQTCANDTSNVNCEVGQVNGHEQQQDESTSMTFDIFNECNDSQNNLIDSQPATIDCFSYANVAINDVEAAQDTVNNGVRSNNGQNINNNHCVDQTPTAEEQTVGIFGEQQQHQQIDQNLCSPVTQIYNKIVDDIETYALPLEANQFNSSHHHHLHGMVQISSLPAQSMDLSDTSGANNNNGMQPHNTNDGHRHRHLLGLSRPQASQLKRPFVNQHQSHDSVLINKCQTSACSIDLATCDLFGTCSDRSNLEGASGQSEADREASEGDNLLLSEFNLPAGGVGDHQVNDDLAAGVVDSLTNVDDLRDLIMGISSGSNPEQLIDSNSLDLFSFKTTNDCVQRQQQQLDVKSSTSDNDTLNRLSPMTQVPRCNSTGNTNQTPTNQAHQLNRSQHLPSQFMTFAQGAAGNLVSTNAYSELQSYHTQRSASTNPGGSTSCSLSPSASSRNKVMSSSRSACTETLSNHENPHPQPSSSFIKLPLQLRQKSEQQEPSNSVLNSLLPKALSIDGSELSTINSHHRLSTSPLAYEGLTQNEQQEHHKLLLIPSTIDNQQQLSCTLNSQLGSNTANLVGTSLSLATIPLDNSSEILVNAPDNSFQGSSANYSVIHQQQQQQQQQQSSRHVLHTHHQNLIQQQKLSFLPLERTQRPTVSLNGLLPILDYVPNWCNITGGAKVLIVGNWNSLLVAEGDSSETANTFSESSNSGCKDDSLGFFAVFDDQLVPAILIQDNVLRCYAPSHEQGFITLKVIYMNRIVSEQVLFEMRPSCNQLPNQIESLNSNNNGSSNTRDNQSGGQQADPFVDTGIGGNKGGGNNNNNGSTSNTHHRNSTQSNQSSATSSSLINQKPYNSSSAANDTSKVLTLAENIISAMHKKNNSARMMNLPDSRLVSSLDVERLDHYDKNLQQQQHRSYHRSQHGSRVTQRRLSGSRSLSRDSEPNVCYDINFDLAADADPYWHQSPYNMDNSMQPLSVVTDLMFTPTSNNQHQYHHSSGLVFGGQKRHSSGSSNFPAYGFGNNGQPQQSSSSAFMPYAQRSNLGSIYQMPAHSNNHQQQQQQQHVQNESQNLTETSSSGLGSIVSSLSPSTSSLHSPMSACNAVRDNLSSRENQSPCSCGRQSSGTPTSADFCEYFQASAKTEESFASLTLNDREQQELYEAAKIIQKAYRTYRGRKRQASELLVEPNNVQEAVPEYRSNVDCVQMPPGNSCSQNEGSLDGGQQLSTQASAVLLDDQQQAQHHQSLLSQHFGYLTSGVQQQQQTHLSTGSTLVKCYRDREMQAATIIQAYYRRYRQYVHYKRQQNGTSRQQQLPKTVATVSVPQSSNSFCERPNARLVVDTMPVVIDKATTSHVDRKRFKTAILINSSNNTVVSANEL